MAKKNAPIPNTPDAPDNAKSNHACFINALLNRKRHEFRKYKKHSFNREVGIIQLPEMTDVILLPEAFLEPTLKIHPEAAAFLFHLNGCAKNLLFFLVIKKLDTSNGQYRFNQNIQTDFKEFAENLFDVSYTKSTIDQAHRDLVNANATCSIKTGLYFMNPLIAGGKNTDYRRKLMNEYSRLLTKKGIDAKNGIYPIYRKK